MSRVLAAASTLAFGFILSMTIPGLALGLQPVLAQASPAPSAEAPHEGSGGPKPSLLDKLNSLNLTDDQNAAIMEMHKSWKAEEEQQVKENLKLARRELTQAMTSNSQVNEVRRKFESVQKHYLELQNLKFEKSLRIREILNVDQRRKFQDLRLDMSE